jgi:tetratricopeptide (TPR) repeat protein
VFAIRRTLVMAALCAGLGLPATADVSGPYLAARSADRARDFVQASMYFTQALVQDPANATLLDGLVHNQLLAGNVEAATPVARRLQALGVASQAANMVLMAERIRGSDYKGLLADLNAGEQVGLLVDGLVRGWADLGEGRMSEALGAFDTLAQTEGLAFFGLYHKALALAMVGDLEGADALLANPDHGLRTTRRGAIAHIEVLALLDRRDEALALIDELRRSDEDIELATLRQKIEAGALTGFSVLRDARDGMAEVYLLMATALRGEVSDILALLHARVAQDLRPDLHDATLMAASILEGLGQYDLALAAYAKVPENTVYSLPARLSAAQALYAADRKAESLEVLRMLAADLPDVVSVHLALGDTLRRDEQWTEAAASYGRAIDLLGDPEPQHWAIFYSRGIVWERAKEWDRAEPDFRKALVLNPDQPQVLNYLGYSLLDMNRNLAEALAMVERAVEQRPEDGYIIDSLAWGLFLLGRYDEALIHMERASVLMPVDPVVTDHLGDVYWAVGRQREAMFQWRRALSFNPEEKDLIRIRRKLEVGLDAVLAEEGSKPLDGRGE